jgi:tellurite resistance protein TerC
VGFISVLTVDYIGEPLWAWLLFNGLVVLLLALALGVLHRKVGEIRAGESLLLSAGHVVIALIFGAWLWTSTLDAST